MRVRRTPAEKARIAALTAVRGAATAMLAIAFISVAIRLYMDRGWEPSTRSDVVEAESTAMDRLHTIRHLERLEAALEVYRLRHDAYPARLDGLVDDGLVAPSALSFPLGGHEYYYRPSGDSYVLYPPRY